MSTETSASKKPAPNHSVDSAQPSFPYIDDSVRPQDDLNKHVNGLWLKSSTIPDDLGQYGSFMELRDKSEADVRAILEEAATAERSGHPEAPDQADADADADTGAVQKRIGTFYRAFMDAERIESLGLTPLGSFIEEISELTTPAQLLRLSSSWERKGIPGLVHGITMPDAGNPKRELWHTYQSGIGLPDESYYRDDEHADLRDQYKSHLERFFALAAKHYPDFIEAGQDAASAAAGVLELETRIAELHWDRVTLRDAQKRYNLKTLDEVRELMPLIDSAVEGWGLTESQAAEIVVCQPDVLVGFQELLENEPLQSWRNWLRIQVLRATAPMLHAEMVEEHFAFYRKTIAGIPQMQERWKRGVAATNGALGEDVAQIYVARHYPPEARAAMDELIAALIEAYRRSINTLEWMGEETRRRALEKLDAFRPKIGFPERWIDYSDVIVDPQDAFGNVLRAEEQSFMRDLKKLDDGPDPDEWRMTPQTVNAYYSPLENVICFPAAILQPPFFSADRDMAQNFGGIGAVIGHEIGHGFDDQGSRFGPDGSLSNWWNDADREAFEAHTNKLVDQYGRLSPSVLPEKTVNGELTLGENIGDLGGIGIAYEAYKIWLADAQDAQVEGLTGDQRFFYAWAQVWRQIIRKESALTLLSVDPHAPAELRATQPPKNIDAFHAAFNTEPGDGMYLEPQERVRIW